MYHREFIPKPGQSYAFHVYTPALTWNKQHPDEPLPTVAVRPPANDSDYCFRTMLLFDWVVGSKFILTPVEGGLPGTPGVEVALVTGQPFLAFTHWDLRIGPPLVYLHDGITKDEIWAKVLWKYLRRKP